MRARERETTTWNTMLEKASKDDSTPIIRSLPIADWDKEFDPGWGGSEGPPVLAWSEVYVYFPVVYDGAEWLGRAPRHPRALGQGHIGGE